MSVVIVFILVVIGFSLWFLTQQRVFSKPWLEVGADAATTGGLDRTGVPTEKLGLAVFLAVIAGLFALFISAYVMRMEYYDWRSMPVPRLVWLNTVLLLLASVALQAALVAARGGDLPTLRLGLGTASVAGAGFVLGQLAAWQQLAAAGLVVEGNPANGFFYLLTAVHGLHILGGLVALGVTAAQCWDGAPGRRERLPLELCATYWHFLLAVWLVVLTVLVGWADDFISICRQLLT